MWSGRRAAIGVVAKLMDMEPSLSVWIVTRDMILDPGRR